MTARLTSQQEKLHLFVQHHVAQTGRGPTFAQMAEAIDAPSKSNAHRVFQALVDAGYLRRPVEHGHGIEILKTLPDDRFDAAIRAAFDAAGVKASSEQIDAGRDALIDALILDDVEGAPA